MTGPRATSTTELRKASIVADAVRRHRAGEVLSFGLGGDFLDDQLEWLVSWPVRVVRLDPATSSASCPAHPFVVSIDSLPGADAGRADALLDELRRLVAQIGVLVVPCDAARPAAWWLPRLTTRFELARFAREDFGFQALVEPRRD